MSLQNTQNLVTDLCRDNSQRILVKQYEKKSRFIIIKCTENGKFYPLSNKNTKCNIKMLTPDNRAIYNPCEILDNGLVRVSISESMVYAPGVAHAELNVIDLEEATVLATMTFDLVIKPSPYPDERITDSDEFSTLLEIIANEKKRVDALLELEMKVQANEEIRKDHEEIRVADENTRLSNEDERISNERTRIVSEEIRESNESLRESNEETRIDSENLRIVNEEVRASNEDVRITNEDARLEAEILREGNEIFRQEDEIERRHFEDERTGNEEIRIANEELRKETEQIRDDTEKERVHKEMIRELNEKERIFREKQRISNEDDRIEHEKERLDNEDLRESSEEVRIQNEKSRELAEKDRDEEEYKRQVNEKVRRQKEIRREESEKDRILNESLRSDHEELRINNELVRQDSESERISNENTRIDNEQVRKINEMDRQEDEEIRIIHENIRHAAEKLRIYAEKLREIYEDNRKSNEMDRENAEELRRLQIEMIIDATEVAKDRANAAALACENIVAGYGFIPIAEKGTANGVATLNKYGIVPSSQLPSYVDKIYEGTAVGVTKNEETGSLSATGFILTGALDECVPTPAVIYLDTTTNIQYRWTGKNFITTGTGLSLGELPSTAFYGNLGKIAYDHSQSPHAIVDATKVEKSETNGNVIIDGVEANVYTHPDTHPASMIVQDANHRFVTDKEKEKWNAVDSTLSSTSTNPVQNKVIKEALDNIGSFIASPTAPQKTNMLWIDTANGSVMKYYNGSSWVPIGAVWA